MCKQYVAAALLQKYSVCNKTDRSKSEKRTPAVRWLRTSALPFRNTVPLHEKARYKLPPFQATNTKTTPTGTVEMYNHIKYKNTPLTCILRQSVRHSSCVLNKRTSLPEPGAAHDNGQRLPKHFRSSPCTVQPIKINHSAVVFRFLCRRPRNHTPLAPFHCGITLCTHCSRRKPSIN